MPQIVDVSLFHATNHLVQGLPIEQTMAFATCSKELVIAAPPLNVENHLTDFRGHTNTSSSKCEPLFVDALSNGSVLLPPFTPHTSRESGTNTQKVAHCNSLYHLIKRDKKVFKQPPYQRNSATLYFNNNQYYQLETMYKRQQLDNVCMQQVMEVTSKKEALIKVNNAGNEYGRQQNNNGGNNSNNKTNGTGNGGCQGGRSGEGSRGGGNGCGGGGGGQGTGSGNGGGGNEGHNGGGNHGSGNANNRSRNNDSEIPHGSKNTPPILQPEINHTDRQPTIYRPLGVAASNKKFRSQHAENHHSDFHDNTTLWNFPHLKHPVEERNVKGRGVLVIGTTSQRTSVSYEQSIPSKDTSKLAITLSLQYPPQQHLSKESLSPSNYELNQNNIDVIHINTLQTYMFSSENPVPHHSNHINTHPPLLQVEAVDNSIDTITVSDTQLSYRMCYILLFTVIDWSHS